MAATWRHDRTSEPVGECILKPAELAVSALTPRIDTIRPIPSEIPAKTASRNAILSSPQAIPDTPTTAMQTARLNRKGNVKTTLRNQSSSPNVVGPERLVVPSATVGGMPFEVVGVHAHARREHGAKTAAQAVRVVRTSRPGFCADQRAAYGCIDPVF